MPTSRLTERNKLQRRTQLTSSEDCVVAEYALRLQNTYAYAFFQRFCF